MYFWTLQRGSIKKMLVKMTSFSSWNICSVHFFSAATCRFMFALHRDALFHCLKQKCFNFKIVYLHLCGAPKIHFVCKKTKDFVVNWLQWHIRLWCLFSGGLYNQWKCKNVPLHLKWCLIKTFFQKCLHFNFAN